MANDVNVVVGGSHSDQRGTIYFFNDFDMTEIKRFYRIKHHDTTIIRGWRGHKIEQRWFQVYRGTFEVTLIEIDNWEVPSPFLKQTKIILCADEDVVLHIPAGFATSLKAVLANSEMIVFADQRIEYAKHDDYLFPLDYFKG